MTLAFLLSWDLLQMRESASVGGWARATSAADEPVIISRRGRYDRWGVGMRHLIFRDFYPLALQSALVGWATGAISFPMEHTLCHWALSGALCVLLLLIYTCMCFASKPY